VSEWDESGKATESKQTTVDTGYSAFLVTNIKFNIKKSKGSPYSIAEHRVPDLILVLGSQPADDVSHKPGDRLR